MIHELAESFLALALRPPGPAMLGDVPDDEHGAPDRAVGVPDGCGAVLDRPGRPVPRGEKHRATRDDDPPVIDNLSYVQVRIGWAAPLGHLDDLCQMATC